MNKKDRNKLASIRYYLWTKQAETKEKFREAKTEINLAIYKAKLDIINQMIDLIEELPDE